MKKFILILLVLTTFVFAQNQKINIDRSVSFIRYTGAHFLHGWTGQSKIINGQIFIDFNNPSNSIVNISIPIISFDSGNDNRDSNMLFVTEDDIYPHVSFTSTDILLIDRSDYNVRGLLNFHGIEIEIIVPVKVSISSNLIEFISTFKVNLNDYNIERPKLLLKPISELIDVELFIKGTI